MGKTSKEEYQILVDDDLSNNNLICRINSWFHISGEKCDLTAISKNELNAAKEFYGVLLHNPSYISETGLALYESLILRTNAWNIGAPVNLELVTRYVRSDLSAGNILLMNQIHQLLELLYVSDSKNKRNNSYEHLYEVANLSIEEIKTLEKQRAIAIWDLHRLTTGHIPISLIRKCLKIFQKLSQNLIKHYGYK